MLAVWRSVPKCAALRLLSVGGAAATTVLMYSSGPLSVLAAACQRYAGRIWAGLWVYGKCIALMPPTTEGARVEKFFLQHPLAKRRITERAEKGDSSAQTELSEDFLRGDGVKADPAAALRWSQEAALHGEPRAQYILGELYAEGLKPNPDRAFQWFAAAASQGNVKAMHNLAIAFLNGAGVAKNPSTAIYWFTKAANTGYRDSAFDLGVLYERGEGVFPKPARSLEVVRRCGFFGRSTSRATSRIAPFAAFTNCARSRRPWGFALVQVSRRRLPRHFCDAYGDRERNTAARFDASASPTADAASYHLKASAWLCTTPSPRS